MNSIDSTASIIGAPVRTRNLNFMLVCVFIDMLGVGMVMPSLPIFVGELTGSRAMQAYWFGSLVMVFGVVQFLFSPILGGLSDRFGRRPVLLCCMLGMALNFSVTASATSLATLFVGRVIGGLSSANMSVASAYAADISAPEQRAKSFGRIGAAFSVGFIVGPMLGGLLGGRSLQLPMYVAASLCVVNAIYGYLFVAESLSEERRKPFSLAKANAFSSLGRLATRPATRGLFVAFALLVFAQLMSQTAFVLYTNFRYGWTPQQVGVALFFVGLGSVVMQAFLLERLLKRLGEARLTLIGLASGGITFLIYGIATEGWMIYVAIILNIMSFATSPALQSIVSKANSGEGQGTLMGGLQSVRSLAVVVSPLLGSAVLAAGSTLPPGDWRMGTVFILCAMMQLVGILLLWRYFRRTRKTDVGTL